MEKSYYSSEDSASSNNRDQYLRHLNKISHKISKPLRKPHFDRISPPPPPPSSLHQQQNQQQNQPPVYNINKSDFRDVVQKLTGSPAHDRFSNPPPIHPPKPQSSRLQRIRPPPLAHISNQPPPPPPPPPMPVTTSINTANNVLIGSNNFNGGRFIAPISPLSSLPPFPAVHAAAESPISSYMRYLQTSISAADSESNRFSGVHSLSPLVSPRLNNHSSMQMQQQPQYLVPTSPLAFGQIPSPRSPYPLLSPSFLFSPLTGQLGFPQFPLSPRFAVPSPRWRDF